MKKSSIILVLLLFLGASAGLYYGLTRYLEKEKERVRKALEVVEEPEKAEEEESGEVVELPSITYSEADVQEVPPARLMAFDQLLGDAQNEAAIDRWEMSKALLRSAIDLTSNATLRAMAAQEMGSVLLQEAQVAPWPNAMAAEQYLEGALELEKDPVRREQAEERLRETREILYSSQLVEIPETGNRFQMQEALEKARPVMQRTPARQLEYKLREANALQQTVLNPTWFKEYLFDHPEEDPAQAKEKLRNEAENQYSELTKQASGPIRDEAFFRLAELQMEEKKYDQADQTIQTFLDNEPVTFIPETMILLAQIARAKGDPRRANHLFTQHIERYGISGDSQNQIMEVIKEMAGLGFFREAADSLEALTRQPQLETKAHDLIAQSKLYRAEYFFKINEPENAVTILSELGTGDYPPAIKQAAISRLFETQLARNQGNIEMLLTGIQAVESDPENEHAKKILIQMARTVEQMGLPVYAQEIYDKIALLGMASAQNADASVAPLSIEAATLGTARCYFKEGNDLKADYLFRKICNNYNVGALQSEAAFWWAQIAFRHGQLQEASRRLGLMDLTSLPPDFTAKAKILDQFINIRLGISNAEIIDPVLADLASLTDADRDFIRTYYSAFFDMWERRNNLEAMKRWYEGSRVSPHRKEIPLDDFFLRIANVIVEKGTLSDLVAYLDNPDGLLPLAQQEQLLDDLWIPFFQGARQLERTNQGIKLSLNELYRKRQGNR